MRINNVLHRVKHKQGERTGKPLMSNNKGSSFVLVIVSVALIMILIAILMAMMIVQGKMMQLGRQTKGNFYYLEEVLEQMRKGVGNESIKQLKTAYDDTVSMVVFYDTKQQKYMSVSAETAESIMNNKFFENIEEQYCVDNTSLKKILLSYVTDVDVSSLVTADNVQITFGSDFKCEKVQSANPVATIGYRIQDITVSRMDEKGNLQSITTDIAIYPPDKALNFLATGIDLENLFTYAMVADYGLDITATSKSDVRVTGNVYTASDMRNNGIYKGAIAADASGKYSFAGSQPGGDGTTDGSKYSGIYVSGINTSLNLQSDIISCNGCITASNGATINGNTMEGDSSRATQANLWANNIVTAGTEKSSIFMNAQFNMSDDLELNAPKSDVQLRGNYFGYNYAAEEEYVPEGAATATSRGQITTGNVKSHTNSSAIIINGENSKLDLELLNEMVINGRSYIDLISENADSTNENDTDIDIKTAESLSTKNLQLAYRVTEPRKVSSDLPALVTTPTSTVGSNKDALDVPVKYFNMIKFLTKRFFEDGGYKIYTTKEDNDLYDSDWDGIDDSSFDDVWNDIRDKGVKSDYYRGIMDVYFPTDRIIVNKLKDGSTAENYTYKSNSKNELVYRYDTNKKIRVTDHYGNTYEIWDNTVPIATETDTTYKELVEGVHRYGFITVGEKYDMVSLVETRVGKEADPYYFYQFYDEAAKEDFVLDYAKYSSKTAAVDDLYSTELFPSEEIVFPDEMQSTVYTRGLSTVLDANAEKYEFKRAVNKDSNYSEVELMKMYNEKIKKSYVYKSYFPKSESMIDTNMLGVSEGMFVNGIRTAKGLFNYSTKDINISPLTNPESVEINWNEVVSHESANGGAGVELEGYTGARVWVSQNDIVIDGDNAVFKGGKMSGIVLCMGDVTLNNVEEFTGTIITVGKLYIRNTSNTTTKFYADEQMCNGMLQNDKNNMIRTCFGLKKLETGEEDKDLSDSVTSISDTDLVGFEKWVRNDE